MKNRKLKIAVFHLAFVYSGGGEKLVLKEIEGLKKLGHKVDIYSCVVDKKKCFSDLTNRLTIHEFLPWVKPFLKNHEAFQVILSCILAPFFAYKFKGYNIIFAANQPSLWIAYIVKTLYSIKYVGYLAQPTRFLYPRKIDKEIGLYFIKKGKLSLSTKLMEIFKGLIKKIDIQSVRCADKILVNGKYIGNQINRIYKIKVEDCPAGAEYSNKPLDIKSRMRGTIKINNYFLKKPYILMTNRHAWQKRFEYGLSAFSALLAQNRTFSLVISGTPTEYTDELKVEIERMGLMHKVNFIGLVKEVDIKRLYRNAEIYLYTSPQEDFGMGVIEAMGQGLPVIAWNDGGPIYTIFSGETGYLAKNNDIEDFTHGLIKITNDKKMIIKMGKNAISRVKNAYSWSKHINLLEDSLKSLIN
jgi:glycosyltransferase involved in cell wall biosynthesis